MHVTFSQIEISLKAFGYKTSKNIKVSDIKMPPENMGERLVKGGKWSRRTFFKQLPGNDRFVGSAYFQVSWVGSSPPNEDPKQHEAQIRLFFKTKQSTWVTLKIHPLTNEQIAMGVGIFEKQLMSMMSAFE